MIHVSQILVWGCFTESNMVRPHPSCTHKSLMFGLTELLQLCYLYLVSCWLWEDCNIHVPPLLPVDGIMIKSAHNMSICSIQPIDVFLSSTVVWNWAYHWVSADSCQMHVFVRLKCICMYIMYVHIETVCVSKLKKRPQCSSHLNESCYTRSPF